MSSILNFGEEDNICGFTADIKKFLSKGDFKSAIILVNDLKKYILEIKKTRKPLRNNSKKKF